MCGHITTGSSAWIPALTFSIGKLLRSENSSIWSPTADGACSHWRTICNFVEQLEVRQKQNGYWRGWHLSIRIADSGMPTRSRLCKFNDMMYSIHMYDRGARLVSFVMPRTPQR